MEAISFCESYRPFTVCPDAICELEQQCTGNASVGKTQRSSCLGQGEHPRWSLCPLGDYSVEEAVSKHCRDTVVLEAESTVGAVEAAGASEQGFQAFELEAAWCRRHEVHVPLVDSGVARSKERRVAQEGEPEQDTEV